MKRIGYLVVFTVFVVFLSCDNNDYAARVGNYVVNIQDVRSAVNSRKGLRKIEFDAVLDQVNHLVEKKIMLIGAVRAGLENDSDVVANLSDIQDKHIYSYLIQKDIIDKVVTKQIMLEKYNRQSREWHVRHIFFPLGDKTSPAKPALVDELDRVRSRLLKGDDFDAVARTTSKDSLSAGKGGDLGFLKWDDKKYGATFFPAVEKMSPGQISKIIETDAGLHIVKVEQVREVKQPPFEKMQEQLQRSFFREKNALLDSTYFAYIDYLKEKFSVEYNQENIDSLYSIIVEKKKDDLIPRREPLDLLKSMSPEQQNLPLVVYKGGTYTIEMLFKSYAGLAPMRRPVLNSASAVQNVVDRILPRLLIIKYGHSKNVHKKATVRKAMSAEREKVLVQRAEEIFVDEKINVTEQDMRAQYENFSEKYEEKGRTKVLEIQVSELLTAKRVFEKANAGADFQSLAKSFHEKVGTNSKDGNLGFIGAGEYGIVGQKSSQMKIGEISEPIKNGNFYSIVKVVDREPAKTAAFDAVRGRINRELKRQQKTQLQEEWLNGLRESVSIFIYNDALKREFGLTD